MSGTTGGSPPAPRAPAPAPGPSPGDRVRASVLVRVPPREAFDLYTGHIDAWWKRGARFRHAAARSGLIHLEPRVGGRLFESFESFESSAGGAVERVVEVGRVLAWEPPTRLVFSWRNEAFTPLQTTTVEVSFEPASGGTQVTVVHRGWDGIPADHSVRHGLAVGPFLRMMGLWWGEQLSALRALAHAAPKPPPATPSS